MENKEDLLDKLDLLLDDYERACEKGNEQAKLMLLDKISKVKQQLRELE